MNCEPKTETEKILQKILQQELSHWKKYINNDGKKYCCWCGYGKTKFYVPLVDGMVCGKMCAEWVGVTKTKRYNIKGEPLFKNPIATFTDKSVTITEEMGDKKNPKKKI